MKIALLGFLGNSHWAGRGNAIDGGDPREDRLGADRRTASIATTDGPLRGGKIDAFPAAPLDLQEVRARNIGRVIVSSITDCY